jgi:hypothetical protein
MASNIGTRRVGDAAASHDVAVARATVDGGETGAQSAVSWAAIFGGAFAAIALTVILMSLGAGFGLTAVSTQTGTNPSPTTFGVVAAIWLVVVQWLSSGVGGYIAGRLRTKWTGLHTDEVFFRDTAHGFLAWAAATLFIVLVAASAGSSALKGVTSAAASLTSGMTQAVATSEQGSAPGAPNAGAFLDGLFRSNNPGALSDQDARTSAGAIFANAVRNGGDLSPDDRTYLAQLVAAKTGIGQDDAQQRVDRAFGAIKDAAAKARQAAETARKSAASAAIITGLALLIGAFVASAAGAVGGRLRDRY